MLKKGIKGKLSTQRNIQQSAPSNQNFNTLIKEDNKGKRTIYYIPKPKTTQYEDPMAQMLMQSALEVAMAFQGTPDKKITYSNNINARLNEPSHDLASRRLSYPIQIKERIKQNENEKMKEDPNDGEGIQSQDPFNLLTGSFTEESQEGTLLQQQMGADKENQIESKMLQKDNAQTIKELQYQYGATDCGHQPINKEFTNTPYPIMKTAYYMKDGGIQALRAEKQYLDKQSRINRSKERKNYIKTSKLMQSIATQDTLKKHDKNKKK